MEKLRYAVAVSAAALLLCGTAQAASAAPAAPAGQQQQSPSSDPAAAGSTSWLPATPANWPLVVDYSRTKENELTRGVEQYSETYDTVAGRQHIQVLTADLADPNVRTGVVEADDKIIVPSEETTSSMAARTGAVAGVNGGYFDINATGQPLGGVISGGTILKSPTPDFNAQLGVRPDGSIVMGQENFSGTVTDGTESYPLTSVNTEGDEAAGKITELTSYLGAASGLTAGTLVLGTATDATQDSFTVTSVQAGVTSVPQLAQGEVGLMAAGTGGQWLSGDVHVGDTVNLATQISPDNDLTQLIGGVDMLVKDGQAYDDPTGTPPSGVNPETAIGISQDGKHVIAVAIDGHEPEDTAVGVSPAEVAGYMVAHGAYTAELFDGGGSTTEVGREPGASTVSVLNTPSDQPGNTERPVADGLFFYSTQSQASPAAKTVINGGAPVTTVADGSIPVPAYATDALGNPATGAVTVRVEPPSLATWSNGELTPLRGGTGVIIATDGRAESTEKLTVVPRLASLSVAPTDPDVGDGATQQLALSGTDPTGRNVEVPASAASWQVNPSSLGSVDAQGLFTAAASGGGMAAVTATVAGATATASIAVGSVTQLLDPMASTAAWSLSNNTTGQPAALSVDAGDVPPGSTETASLKLGYTMPAGSGVKQLVLSPTVALQTTADNGQDPNGIGMWIKGNGTGIELAESYVGVNGARTTLYPTTVTWNGWQFVVAQLPAGLQYPLSISFIDFLGISPSTTTSGSLNVSGLQALYSPRPIVTPQYQPIPDNPSWLRYEQDPADFASSGSTLLLGGDADLLAALPESAGAKALAGVEGALPSLSPQAKPGTAQFLGDLSGDGATTDLQSAQTAANALGLPVHDAVGGGETANGKNPETGDFAQVFGATHYAYAEGAADVIVTDSSHGGILASDPYQSPAVSSQYQWLVQQLSDVTAPTKDVLVATQLPAYDPTGSGKNQFADAWEAQMYVRLLQKYQRSHPAEHLIMVAGDATGFSEQILDPEGDRITAADGGIPQFTFADLGATAEAPSNEGGFAHFGLIRIGDGGKLQFAVEPVLSSIAVAQATTALAPGATTALTATGTEAGGGTMPVADPASHVWSSSDRRIASVDPVTGLVTAHRAGTVTISVTSGTATGSVQLTVG